MKNLKILLMMFIVVLAFTACKKDVSNPPGYSHRFDERPCYF